MRSKFENLGMSSWNVQCPISHLFGSLVLHSGMCSEGTQMFRD